MASQILIAKPKIQVAGVKRPTADFHPCVWGDTFLNFIADGKDYVTKRKQEIESLKLDVMNKLVETVEMPFENLKLIDAIERLGVAYHFENEINECLKKTYEAVDDHFNLYGTSVRFRILRQHGYYVSSDIFLKFMDGHGNFLESLKSDVDGLLGLYDAAYLRCHEEDILDKALTFTIAELKCIASNPNGNPLAPQIKRALVYPNHKGMTLIESRYYISFYEKDPSHVSSLLKLSKLEFDLRQSLHKEELQQLTKWWRSFDFPSTFPFIRDRVVEAYLFGAGILHDPKFSVARVVYTKAFLILSILDDIYDSYGTIEELEPFTQAIEKWDKSCTSELPDYMKLFYEIQCDSYKEFEDEAVKLGTINYVPYAVKEVITLSKAYLQEVRWTKMEHDTNFDHFFDNAIKTSGTTLMVIASLLYNYVDENAAIKTFESVSENSKPQRASCIIGRFMNDLVDYEWDKHREHAVGGVECYIKQYGVSEEEAFSAINMLIENAWKDINEELISPTTHIAKPLLPYIYNLCCVIDFVYKHDNGYTVVSAKMKEAIKNLFIQKISI